MDKTTGSFEIEREIRQLLDIVSQAYDKAEKDIVIGIVEKIIRRAYTNASNAQHMAKELLIEKLEINE